MSLQLWAVPTTRMFPESSSVTIALNSSTSAGLWTLLAPENNTARVVNFWVWAVMYGIGIVFMAILTVMLTFGIGSFSGSGGIIFAWWVAFGLQLLFAYLILGVAWYWIEEGKDDGDAGYEKA